MRKLLLMFSGLATTIGVVFAAASPALAVSGSICTFNGNHYCAGSTSLFDFTNVISRNPPGRTWTFAPPIGGSGVIRNTGGNVCMAPQVGSGSYVLLVSCSSAGVSWTFLDNGDGSRSFKNVKYGCYLAGDDHNGNNWACNNKSPGWFWRMQPFH